MSLEANFPKSNWNTEKDDLNKTPFMGDEEYQVDNELEIKATVSKKRGSLRLNRKIEKPGDYGISPSTIPYKVRDDGSRSFVGYGGAFD